MKAARESPSFGDFLRAARLGFGWSPAVHAFVRVCDDGPDAFSVECAPPGMIPPHPRRAEHRCWWETEGADIAPMIGPLRRVVRVKRPLSFRVDEQGEILR